MTAVATETSSKRRLLLASDRSDQSSELASILQSVGEVDTIPTSEIPDAPASHVSGIVVDINLRSPRACSRCATSCGAKPTARCRGCSFWRTRFITGRCRPGRWAPPIRSRGRSIAEHILQRIRAAFPDTVRLRRDRPRQGAEPGRRRRAGGDGQDIREAAGGDAAEVQRHRGGRKQDPQAPSSRPRCANG